MAMPAAHANWTVELLDALPDDGARYEIIDGELYVTPAPSDVHQLVAGAFHRRLHDYLRATLMGRAMISPADVRKGDRSRNRVQPDVFAVRLVDGKRPPYPYDLRDVLLAIEIVAEQSPARLSDQARPVSVEWRAGILDRQCGRTCGIALAIA
jgi:Uma2 family endonuclease